jgi:hypothetical protein
MGDGVRGRSACQLRRTPPFPLTDALGMALDFLFLNRGVSMTYRHRCDGGLVPGIYIPAQTTQDLDHVDVQGRLPPTLSLANPSMMLSASDPFS